MGDKYKTGSKYNYCSGENLFKVKKNPGSVYTEPGLKIGDDLLSRRCSTIGANGLNFSVRNGKRWNPIAIVT